MILYAAFILFTRVDSKKYGPSVVASFNFYQEHKLVAAEEKVVPHQ